MHVKANEAGWNDCLVYLVSIYDIAKCDVLAFDIELLA